jgi:hypothetical protein
MKRMNASPCLSRFSEPKSKLEGTAALQVLATVEVQPPKGGFIRSNPTDPGS